MTRAQRQAALWRAMLALMATAVITIVASIDALRIGPAAAALLYLLPVLWVSARAGLNAGLVTAVAAAFCYNFFLLEPRYTLQIHGVGDVAAFLVLTVVAVVTSRLAADLRSREQEAQRRAEASELEAGLASQLARIGDRGALDCAALALFTRLYGQAHLVRADDLAAKRTALPPLDAAAAAWALHHGAISGRATEVMPSADFRFISLGPGSADVLALAAGDEAAGPGPLAADGLARIWVQARDRLDAEGERQAREAADSREAIRRTLLAALGHDFRTPLTVLRSGLEAMGGEAAPSLLAEVDRLVRLSDDLIAAARLEGGAPLTLEPVDLVDIVAAAVPMPTAQMRVSLRTDIPAELPLVRADSVMLVHVIGNLVDNALRHARANVIVIVAAVAERGCVRIDVRDDGSGLDPMIADAIFERHVAGSDREGGAGLGLAIARDLATAMGATLSAANHVDGGACFSLTIPTGAT